MSDTSGHELTARLPGVLHDATLARATYERLEEEVTEGVVAHEKVEKEKADTQPKKPSGTQEKAERASVATPSSSEVKTPSSSSGSAARKPVTGDKGPGVKSPEKAQKRADENAGSEHTDSINTHIEKASSSDVKKHEKSEKRAAELAEQLGVDDKVKPGESFADAVKEGTAADTAHVHRGDSQSGAGTSTKSQKRAEEIAVQETDVTVTLTEAAIRPDPKEYAKTQARASELAEQLGVDDKVKPGESFADAVKEEPATLQSSGKSTSTAAKGQKRADEIAAQQQTDPADTHGGTSRPDAKQQEKSNARAAELAEQHGIDDKVKPGETFADAIKEGTAAKGQKRADEVAHQERTDPADTHVSGVSHPGAKQHGKSQARAAEVAEQHGIHDKVQPGESFADAIKGSTPPHHDSHVHKGESFADALKEHQK